MNFSEEKAIAPEKLAALYTAVGWVAYTQDISSLARAVSNSTYVCSLWHEEALLGLARCISDDVAICYVQDLLVHPDYQHQGLGRQLLTRCLQRFSHVRMKILLTDDEERQLAFYKSLGFARTQDMSAGVLNTFVQWGPFDES